MNMAGMGGNFLFLMFTRLLLESLRGAGGAVSNPKEGGNPGILQEVGKGRVALELPLFGKIFSFSAFSFSAGKTRIYVLSIL